MEEKSGGLPPLSKDPSVGEVLHKMDEMKMYHKDQCTAYINKITDLEQQVHQLKKALLECSKQYEGGLKSGLDYSDPRYWVDDKLYDYNEGEVTMDEDRLAKIISKVVKEVLADISPEEAGEFLREHRQKKTPKTKQPSIKTMEKWMYDGVAKATDGCRVEPDCTACPHGYPSWLVELGLI